MSSLALSLTHTHEHPNNKSIEKSNYTTPKRKTSPSSTKKVSDKETKQRYKNHGMLLTAFCLSQVGVGPVLVVV
jgi:hypothetical protein